MPKGLRYIVNESGRKEAVIVPVKVWEEMNFNYWRTQRKLEILSGITDGLEEVAEAKRTGKKLQTLNDFLRKCDCKLSFTFMFVFILPNFWGNSRI